LYSIKQTFIQKLVKYVNIINGNNDIPNGNS